MHCSLEANCLSIWLSLHSLYSEIKYDGTHIIRLQGLNTVGFSALGYIFINADLPADETEEIMKHEQNHLDHLHFFDIVFIETAGILQWFNPFIHMLNRSLRAVHEYQADEGCIKDRYTCAELPENT